MKTFLSLLRPYRKLALLTLFFGTFTVLCNVGLLATSAYLIAYAALQPPILFLMVPIVGVRFFGISRAVSRYVERYVSHDVTFRILAQIRTEVYRILEPLAPARLMGLRSGDLLSRIVNDVETLQYVFLRVLSPPLVALFTMVVWGLILAWFDPTLSAAYALCYLVAGAGIPLALKRLSRGVGMRTAAVKSGLNSFIVENIQGMVEILSYGHLPRQRARLEELHAALKKQQRRNAALSGLSTALTGLCMNLTMILVIALAVPMVAEGRIPGIYLAMLGLGTLSSFEAILPLPLAFHNYDYSKAAATRLHELSLLEPAVPDAELAPLSGKERGSSAAAPASLPRYDLVFENVSFRYGPGEPWVLRHLNLYIPEGGRVAVTGPSGAGKSTIVNLLLRFWDYEVGSIRLGGRELKDFTPEEARRLIGVVTQNTYLFNATIRENLLLAKPEASDDELVEVARRAKLHDFIMNLPEGYDTYIGQDGLKLSGGQRQRLAIARALLKDAPILILDEATKGLDKETEREVMAQINELMTGRTTLVITHNLEGLDGVDEVFELKAPF